MSRATRQHPLNHHSRNPAKLRSHVKLDIGWLKNNLIGRNPAKLRGHVEVNSVSIVLIIEGRNPAKLRGHVEDKDFTIPILLEVVTPQSFAAMSRVSPGNPRQSRAFRRQKVDLYEI